MTAQSSLNEPSDTVVVEFDGGQFSLADELKERDPGVRTLCNKCGLAWKNQKKKEEAEAEEMREME
ncbi:hypothetical protein HKX48_007731, partial [Thoreauomyces humboldtii]